jgi:hypothetical protein
VTFLGGRSGALPGHRQFRHKTKKVPFRIVFCVVVVFPANRRLRPVETTRAEVAGRPGR